MGNVAKKRDEDLKLNIWLAYRIKETYFTYKIMYSNIIRPETNLKICMCHLTSKSHWSYLGSIWLFEHHIRFSTLSNITLLQYFFQLRTKQTLSVTIITHSNKSDYTEQRLAVKYKPIIFKLQNLFTYETLSSGNCICKSGSPEILF